MVAAFVRAFFFLVIVKPPIAAAMGQQALWMPELSQTTFQQFMGFLSFQPQPPLGEQELADRPTRDRRLNRLGGSQG